MIIEQAFTVDASRDETAALLVDVPRMVGCIPGVDDIEELKPGKYQAVLGVRLGPIRAAFQGVMSLDASGAPARLTATGEGRDRATGSVAKVQFAADLLEESPGRTSVTAVTDLALRGKMGQFGTGVMRAAAGEIVQEFASRVNASLAAERAAGGPATQGPVGTAQPRIAPGSRKATAPGLAGVLSRAAWNALKRRVHDVTQRLTQRLTQRAGKATSSRRAS